MKISEEQAAQVSVLRGVGSDVGYITRRVEMGIGGQTDLGLLDGLHDLAGLAQVAMSRGDQTPALTAVLQQQAQAMRAFQSRANAGKQGLKMPGTTDKTMVAIRSMGAAAQDAANAKKLYAAAVDAARRADRNAAVGLSMKYVVAADSALTRAALNEKSRLYNKLQGLAQASDAAANQMEQLIQARTDQTGMSAETSKLSAQAGQYRAQASDLRADADAVSAADVSSPVDPSRMSEVANKFSTRMTVQNTQSGSAALISVLKGLQDADLVQAKEYGDALKYYGNDALGQLAADVEYGDMAATLRGLAGMEPRLGIANLGAASKTSSGRASAASAGSHVTSVRTAGGGRITSSTKAKQGTTRRVQARGNQRVQVRSIRGLGSGFGDDASDATSVTYGDESSGSTNVSQTPPDAKPPESDTGWRLPSLAEVQAGIAAAGQAIQTATGLVSSAKGPVEAAVAAATGAATGQSASAGGPRTRASAEARMANRGATVALTTDAASRNAAARTAAIAAAAARAAAARAGASGSTITLPLFGKVSKTAAMLGAGALLLGGIGFAMTRPSMA